MVKVVAEHLLLAQVLEVFVGGGDHADVQVQDTLAAHALDLRVIEEAQQLRLGRQAQVADFVKEHGAAIGLLQLAHPGRARARERALLVTKELALDEVTGNCRAIDGDKRPRRPHALQVNRTRDQFLAHAALAGDKHARRSRRHAPDDAPDPPHPGRLADHLVPLLQLALQVLDLLLQVGRVERVPDRHQHAPGVARRLEEIGRPELQRRHRGGNRNLGRGHHDRQGRGDSANLLQHVDAAGVPQHQVDNHEVRHFGLDCGNQALPVRERPALVPATDEDLIQRSQRLRLFTCDKYDLLHNRLTVLFHCTPYAVRSKVTGFFGRSPNEVPGR